VPGGHADHAKVLVIGRRHPAGQRPASQQALRHRDDDVFDGKERTEDEFNELLPRPPQAQPIIPTPGTLSIIKPSRADGRRPTRSEEIGVNAVPADAIDRPDVAVIRQVLRESLGYLYPAALRVVATLRVGTISPTAETAERLARN